MDNSGWRAIFIVAGMAWVACGYYLFRRQYKARKDKDASKPK